jgi:dCTP deaminase
MILSDASILARLARGDLKIEPLPDPDMQVQPASVDLTLGDELLFWRLPLLHMEARHAAYGGGTDDPGVIVPANPSGLFDARSPEWMARMREWECFHTLTEARPAVWLDPGAFVLGTTRERIALPPDLAGRVEGRSSLGRSGLVVHLTAGFCDPGFEGQVTLEISVVGDHAVALHRGMRISQLVLHQLDRPAARPYGHPSRGSKYQGQIGTTPPRWENERPLKPST